MTLNCNFLKISFQGEHGAYSEQAIKEYFSSKNILTLPSISFSDAVDRVFKKEVLFLKYKLNFSNKIQQKYCSFFQKYKNNCKKFKII